MIIEEERDKEGRNEGGTRETGTYEAAFTYYKLAKPTLSPEEGLGTRPLTCISALETMPKQEAACCLMLILRVSSCTDRGCQSGYKIKTSNTILISLNVQAPLE